METKSFRWRVETRVQLAHFIQKKLGISGKKVRRLLEKNSCKINQRIERFGSVWLEVGAVVEFFFQEESQESWSVLLDHPSFQILDKPLSWVCSESNCEKTFGRNLFLVHRLDKDTTGALLMAKTKEIRDELMALFASREVEKEYLALVDGLVKEDSGLIDNFLSKKGVFQGQTIWGSSKTGDRAITYWKVVSRGLCETLVSCKPVTGRTHQIRVHMAEMGHPILVDRQYAKSFRSKIMAPRPLLHAYRLTFTFRGDAVDVVSPLPEDLKMRIPPSWLK